MWVWGGSVCSKYTAKNPCNHGQYYVSTPLTMGQRKPKKKKKKIQEETTSFSYPYRLNMQNENALLYLFKK